MTSTWTDQRLELQLMGTFDLWLWQWVLHPGFRRIAGFCLNKKAFRHVVSPEYKAFQWFSNTTIIPWLITGKDCVFRRTVVNNLHSLNMPVSLCLYSRKQLSIYVAFNANHIHSHRKIHTTTLCLQSLRVKSRESLKQTTFAVYSIGIGVFFRFLYKAWGIQMHSSHFHQETEYGKSLIGNGPSLACAGAGC